MDPWQWLETRHFPSLNIVSSRTWQCIKRKRTDWGASETDKRNRKGAERTNSWRSCGKSLPLWSSSQTMCNEFQRFSWSVCQMFNQQDLHCELEEWKILLTIRILALLSSSYEKYNMQIKIPEHLCVTKTILFRDIPEFACSAADLSQRHSDEIEIYENIWAM